MAFDFKKAYPDLYAPKTAPALVDVPDLRFIAVDGAGDPNEEGGAYADAMEQLYGIAYTLKMSYKIDHAIAGYFEYVVPPPEGLWRQQGVAGFDPARKDQLAWTSMIRLPDFVGDDDLAWALEEATRKKKRSFAGVHLLEYREGSCVQCLHRGPYDDEPASIDTLARFAQENGLRFDHSDERLHHEIYLSDPRRCAPEKLKTVLRIPVAPR